MVYWWLLARKRRKMISILLCLWWKMISAPAVEAKMLHKVIGSYYFCLFLDENDSSNMYFAFRWILILFKREFSMTDIMRLWEVRCLHIPYCISHFLGCTCSVTAIDCSCSYMYILYSCVCNLLYQWLWASDQSKSNCHRHGHIILLDAYGHNIKNKDCQRL